MADCKSELGNKTKTMSPGWQVVINAHLRAILVFVKPRKAMTKIRSLNFSDPFLSKIARGRLFNRGDGHEVPLRAFDRLENFKERLATSDQSWSQLPGALP